MSQIEIRNKSQGVCGGEKMYSIFVNVDTFNGTLQDLTILLSDRFEYNVLNPEVLMKHSGEKEYKTIQTMSELRFTANQFTDQTYILS